MIHPAPLTVTDHAVVRYLERIAALDIAQPVKSRRRLAEAFVIARAGPEFVRAAREAILGSLLKSGAPLDWPDPLVVRTERFDAVVANGAVVTIKRPGDGNRRGTNVFERAALWDNRSPDVPGAGAKSAPEAPSKSERRESAQV